MWFAALPGLSVKKMGPWAVVALFLVTSHEAVCKACQDCDIAAAHTSCVVTGFCIVSEWTGRTYPDFFCIKKPYWCLCAKAPSHLLTFLTAKMNPNQDFLQPRPIWILSMMGHSHSLSRSRNPSVAVVYLQKWPAPAAEEGANSAAVDIYVVVWPGGEFHPFR